MQRRILGDLAIYVEQFSCPSFIFSELLSLLQNKSDFPVPHFELYYARDRCESRHSTGGQVNVPQYLTFISSLEDAKVYSETVWGGAMDLPLWICHWQQGSFTLVGMGYQVTFKGTPKSSLDLRLPWLDNNYWNGYKVNWRTRQVLLYIDCDIYSGGQDCSFVLSTTKTLHVIWVCA